MGDLIYLEKRVGKELWEMSDDELLAFLFDVEDSNARNV